MAPATWSYQNRNKMHPQVPSILILLIHVIRFAA